VIIRRILCNEVRRVFAGGHAFRELAGLVAAAAAAAAAVYI